MRAHARAIGVLAVALTVTPAAPAQSNASIGDRVLVRFDRGIDPAEQASLLAASGLAIDASFDSVPGLVRAVRAAGGGIGARTASILADRAGVRYVEPDVPVSIHATPSDGLFENLWGLHNVGQMGGVADADIDAPEAWDRTTGDAGVAIMVIDTGVDIDHPDLVGNLWTNTLECGGVAGLDDDGNGYLDDCHGYDTANDDGNPDDDNGHGTHVSGTIGAVGDNGIGMTGVMWDATIVNCKFLDASGSGFTSDAVACFDYTMTLAASGVPIVAANSSWGGGGYSQALRDAIDAAGDAGIVTVAAAGNDGTDNDLMPHYPSSYASSSVLAVASTTRTDAMSGFSNRGAASVDVAAPGSGIVSTVPGGGYASFSGTSMAAPHVAGVVGLVKAANPGMGAAAIISRITSSVDPLGSLSGRVATGGRVNAAAALSGGGGPTPTPGSLAFTTSTRSVTESAGSVAMTVARTGGATGTVGVAYATAPGSATAGEDYAAAGGTVSLAPGVTSATVSIPILDDGIDEPSEAFTVSLSSPTGGATLGSPLATTVTIVDDDAADPIVVEARPDAMVSKRSVGPFRGDDVVNDDATGQTMGKNGRRGIDKTFYLRLLHRTPVAGGSTPQAIVVRAGELEGGMQTRFYFRGDDVTWQVRNGLAIDVSPGETVTLRVVQRFRRAFARGTLRGIFVSGTWTNPADAADVNLDVVRLQLRYR